MVKIPYGTSNFELLIKQGYYYADRTFYINRLEELGEKYVAFLRPRRFGKSLWISTLKYYYGLEHKDKFEQLFGNLYIGKHPTPLGNSLLVLKFDFSGIRTETFETTFNGFLENVKAAVFDFTHTYSAFFSEKEREEILSLQSPDIIISRLFKLTKSKTEHLIYVLIDEYDHFANELIAFHFDDYQSVVSRNGYVRKFYEQLKIGTGDGIVDRIFITGVSPITLDSFTSGFNISQNLTTDISLHELMGFTSEEVEMLMLKVGVQENDLSRVMTDLREWYNGYLFHHRADQRLYNPNMILHFALGYQKAKGYPDKIIDTNIASDYGKLHRMFRIGDKDEQNYDVIEKLLLQNELTANLTTQFSFEKKFDQEDFISLLFYLGMTTIKEGQLDGLVFQRPNYVIGELYYDYFRKIIFDRAQLVGDKLQVRERIIKLAQENNPYPFVEMVAEVLSALSNRDSIGFDEKHVKAIITSLFYATGIYTIKSEYETERKYVDILLKERPPIHPNFTFALELKYLKKSDAHKLDEVKENGMAQLKSYIQHQEIQQMRDLKAWLFVFVGTEVGAVEEVG